MMPYTMSGLKARIKRLFIPVLFYMISFVHIVESSVVDLNGYILFCPCMGRFGNQADHFLGVLGFSQKLNRTLVLPPWVEYRKYAAKSTQVPFDTYFKVESLEKFHRVVTMERFMKELAPTIWPPEKRIVLCYMSRGNNDCNAKEGNPFGPFWDTFSVDFVKSEFYSPLDYGVHRPGMTENWNNRYPPSKYPVLAFTGAPASFPVQKENRDLHRYLEWNDVLVNKAVDFIRNKMPEGPFIGIHLRNGVDWERACTHLESSQNLFSAPQCLGYHNENGVATSEMCIPSLQTILSQLKRLIKEHKPKAVFVASDDNHMLKELSKGLKFSKVTVVRYEPSDPHIDLVILGRSNHLVANCISSFSAFAVRERKVKNLTYSFWAFPADGGKFLRDEF